MKFLEILIGIWNRFWLSILWIICCIPIVTIGPATTAFCGMMNRMNNKKEGYVKDGFVELFKANYKQSTIVGLVMAFMFFVLYADEKCIEFLVANFGGNYSGLIPGLYMLYIVYGSVFIYIFPYMAKFEDDTKTVFKNAFFISLRHWGITFTTLAIDVILWWSCSIFPANIVILPLIVGWINIKLVSGVLKKYEIR